ncbi:uncharacterized protein Prosap isoform X2 [Lepeophtheirus salmonis]|uniref:uncharacterized protein Prosap isoform X2 n=1 Tax=Lepeophtheirus salmonis TaxID=72036 RepID=UPI001AE3EA41|nr:uncharacterized protein LOC121118817 isoform X2 [Lepeophtheirus salmonis]
MDADTESVSSSGVDGGSSIITNDSGGGGGGSGGSLLPAEVGSATRTKPAFVTVRIRIPDLNVENTLQFQNHELIWDVKQQCLSAIPKELQESFNYGLFYPPSNGKAGKFLDEERRLSEYPFQGSVGYLELKYKRRVYKMLQMDEKQLKTINSRANHKKIVDYINSSNIEKVNKMLTKGLDPNFHCHDSGETPLCLAAGIKGKTSRLIIALINGGAILDFRTKDGTTALHRAVTKNNSESVKTLLDLGASPNYKDGRGLTPLYHAVASSSDVNLVEMLLHDHAMVGVQDRQEWHEVHHACRNGLIQHLEHLLFYSADINARNASGNTPLHVCAVNNQESCARILLFRGCETEALNFAGQTPYQVAVIAGNLELAEIIRNHKAEDIVPFKNAPKFNPRRRTSASSTLSRTASDASMCQTNTTTMSTLPYQPRMESPLVNSLRTGSMNNKPPSPSPSDRSLPPFSSGGSSVSETTSTGSGASSVQHQENNHEVEDEQLDSASTLAASMANDPRCDSVSLSSGVGTSSQSGSSGSAATPTSEPPKATVLHSGMHVVCVETYVSSEEGSLKINAGDIIQVTGSTDDGRLEGMIRGQSGYFPASCAQEVRLRNPDAVHSPPITSTPAPGSRVLGRRELRENRPYQFLNNRFMGLEPRTAILHKGKKGFGFVLRGAKAASPLMEIIPSEKCPGLQYMDDVDPEGVADMAGIKKGDFLIAINGDDVTQASHETVVNLIRKSGDSVALTIVTINIDHIREMEYSNGGSPASISKARAYSTLPRKMQGRSMVAPPPPPKRDPSTTLSVGRAKARSMVANLAALEVLDRAINEHDSNSIENKFNIELLPSSSPKMSSPTIAATSQTNTKSPSNSQKSSPVKTKDETPIYQQSGKYYSKNGTVLRKEFYSTPALNGQAGDKKDVAIDVVERKIHSQEDINKATLSQDIVDSKKTINDEDKSERGTQGYFTLPSKTKQKKSLELHDGYRTLTKIRPVATTAKPPMVINTSPTLPPPEHPPPPPPSTQVVKVDSSNIPNSPPSDYAKVERKTVPTSPPASSDSPLSPTSGVMSSFKPSDNAKLYASPESIHALGYRIPQKHGGSPLNGPIHDPINGITSVQVTKQKKSPTRANSMPPRPKPLLVRKMEQQLPDIPSNPLPPPPPPALQQQQTSPPPSTPPPPPPPVEGQAMETYKVNGVKYTTYTTFRSPLTPDDNQFEGATPDIPEPDYSDPESDHHRRASTTTLEKKKKKSVSFVIDEGDSAKQVSGKPSKVESILKDTNKNNIIGDGNYHYHNYSRASSYDSAVMSASYSEVYARNSSAISDKKVMVAMQSKVKPSVLDESNKVRIDVSNNRLTKSQSFCSDKSSSPNETVKSPPKMSLPAPPAVVSSPPQRQNTGSGGISINDIKTARSQLKPSRSFPNDFSVTNNSTPTQTEDGGDNSSSGVSSDQEVVISTKTDNDKYVTYLPVEGPSTTTSSVKPGSNKPLHPTQMVSSQVWENDSESSDDVSDKSWVLRAEKDSSTGHNIISMKKMLHPKLAALFDVPNASGAGTRTLPNLKHHHHHHNHHHVNIMEARHHLTDHPEATSRVLSRSSPPTKQKSLQAFNNRSIEESLALIQQHVSNLGDTNSNIALSGDLPLGVPPPPSKTEIVVPEVLAPPPGFSDSDSNYSDNDTLSAEQKSLRKKYGKAGGALKKERVMMTRSMDYGQHISSSSSMDYSTLPRSHHAQHFSFKSKNLGNWTVSDVCEWLDSLFMPEYKTAFLQNRIDGRRLMTITKADLEKLGVHRVGHMLNIEKSLKKFAASIHQHHHHQRK